MNRRLQIAVSIALVTIVAATLAAAWLLGPGIIGDAYAGRSYGLFNRALGGRSTHTVDDYVSFFRHALIGCMAALAVTTVLVIALNLWASRVRRELSAVVVVGVLVMLTALVALDRSRYFAEALERDLTAYMTIAAGLVDGKTLYVDLWDHKPPAIHATYAAAAEIFGATPTAVWMLGLTAAALTLWGCYVAGRQVGGRVGGVAAAAVWAIVNNDLLLQANQPNVEVFMNVCLVWAFALLLRSEDDARPWRYVAVGALFFLGSLYKPVVAVTACAVVAAGAVLSLIPGAPGARMPKLSTVVRNLALAAGTAGLCWGLVIGYYVVVGRLTPFIAAVVEYNRDYAGDVGQNVLSGLLPSVDALLPLLPYVPLGLIAGIVAAFALLGHNRRPWGLLLAYLASAWIAVALPGRLYPHYLQLMLPPVAVGAGWLIAGALRRRSPLALAGCGLLLFWPIAARAYQAEVPLAEVPVFKYGSYGYDCLETQRMGRWIDDHYPEPAVVYHWGPDPGVYFYAGRQSPVNFSYNLPLVDGTDRALRYSESVLAQLILRPPDLIVVRRLDFKTIDNPIEDWILERYQPIDGPPGIVQYLFMTPRQASRLASSQHRW